MAFKSENSGKWKLFAFLATMTPDSFASSKILSARTGVSINTTEVYLKEFVRILPGNVLCEGDPPTYMFLSKGETPEELYKKIKEFYNKRAKESRKKKDPPEQTDFVRGKPLETPVFPFAPVLEEEEHSSPSQPPMVEVDMIVLNQIRHKAVQILNPIVAFRMDQIELYQNVIREQQRQAQEILDALSPYPSF